jgi:hypothetical protein
MAFTPEALSITPGWLKERLKETGFLDIRQNEIVPGMTKAIFAHKKA